MAAAAALPLSIVALINSKCLSERPFALATESFHHYRRRPRNSHLSFKNLFGITRPIQLLFRSRSFSRSRLRRDFPLVGA
jgi:hypothetical protein